MSEFKYEIVSARYGTADKSAIILFTKDEGAVAICERDRPDLWAKVKAWVKAGNKIEAHVPLVSPPKPVNPYAQLDALKKLMVAKGIATKEEIDAAVNGIT